MAWALNARDPRAGAPPPDAVEFCHALEHPQLKLDHLAFAVFEADDPVQRALDLLDGDRDIDGVLPVPGFLHGMSHREPCTPGLDGVGRGRGEGL